MRLPAFNLSIPDLSPAFLGNALSYSSSVYDYSMICKIAAEKNDFLTPEELSFCISDFLSENHNDVIPVLVHDPQSSKKY